MRRKNRSANLCFAFGKAVNVAGIKVSGLEITQNSLRYAWSHAELEQHLKN